MVVRDKSIQSVYAMKDDYGEDMGTVVSRNLVWGYSERAISR